MITYVFAGQGTQRKGMGETLFARYQDMVRVADEVLGYSVEALCFAGDRRLDQTEYTQPALFVVNAMMYHDAIDRCAVTPSYLLGHSLGELNALCSAGVFSFETGLQIVKKRGELMGRCSADGALAALLGERSRLLAFVEDCDQDIYLALDNAPYQITVAGTRQAIARLTMRVHEQGLGEVIPVAASGPFHSPFMRDARKEFADFLTRYEFHAPRIPVVANVSASPYQAEEIAGYLADLLVRPVRWVESIRYLLQRGPMLLQEIGPGHVVSSLIRQIILSTEPALF